MARRRTRRSYRWLAGWLVTVAVLVVAALAGTTTGPGAVAGPAPAPSTGQDRAATVDVVPASVLSLALVTTQLGDSFTVDVTQTRDTPVVAGFTLDGIGDLLSGDEACTSLFAGHSVNAAAYAGVELSSSSAIVAEAVESYASVADARTVMAENVAEGRGCHTFTMRINGDVYSVEHEGGQAVHGGLEVFQHRLDATSATGAVTIWMVETRLGGEMMHLLWVATGSFDPRSVAVQVFEDVVTTFRAEHPRRAIAETVLTTRAPGAVRHVRFVMLPSGSHSA